jgi:hypothetical protein
VDPDSARPATDRVEDDPTNTADRVRLQAEIDDLHERLAARDARLAETEAQLEAVQRAREAEVRRLDARVADLERLYLQVLERDERIAELEQELATARAADEVAGPDATPDTDVDSSARSGVTKGGATFPHWETALRARQRAHLDDETARLEETVRHQRLVLEEKEALITSLLRRLGQSPEEAGGPDDLKRISGVGPAIERLLHERTTSSACPMRSVPSATGSARTTGSGRPGNSPGRRLPPACWSRSPIPPEPGGPAGPPLATESLRHPAGPLLAPLGPPIGSFASNED